MAHSFLFMLIARLCLDHISVAPKVMEIFLQSEELQLWGEDGYYCLLRYPKKFRCAKSVGLFTESDKSSDKKFYVGKPGFLSC